MVSEKELMLDIKDNLENKISKLRKKNLGLKNITICVLGLGYIGLPTALLFAKNDFKVTGVDTNKDVVEKLQHRKIHFNELQLNSLLKEAMKKKTFIAKTKISVSDVYIVAVPTPLNSHQKMAELCYVKSAFELISSHIKRDDLIILESTVPPGTTNKLVIPILEKSGLRAGVDFFVSHCPERSIPGKTVYEMINNDRIIGGIDNKSTELTELLYSSFVKGNIYKTNVETAEFVKLIENTFRDINIALANEFAQIAEESNVNVWEAIKLANKHPRVNILKPGPGVGGHCIAIDPWFLTAHSTRSRIISLTREINDGMPRHVLKLVKNMVQNIDHPTITVLGVSYKADVDDARETPALKFIKLAENQGYNVKVHDPFVKEFEYPILNFEDAINQSDCLVLITDHTKFKNIAPQKIAGLMRTKKIVDTRNSLNIEAWKKAGFNVRLLGSEKNKSLLLKKIV